MTVRDFIHQKRQDILSLIHLYGAQRIRLFGSSARREEKKESDIDFLVNFPRGYDLFTQRLPLTQKLQDLLGRKIDLVLEHELNPHIRDHILSEAMDL